MWLLLGMCIRDVFCFNQANNQIVRKYKLDFNMQ